MESQLYLQTMLSSRGPGQAHTILDLPHDALAKIFSHLSLQERLRVREVCHRFLDVSRTAGPTLWAHLWYANRSPKLMFLLHWLRRHSKGAAAGASGGWPRCLFITVRNNLDTWGCVAESVKQCAASLESLELIYPQTVITGNWLAGATRLTRLALQGSCIKAGAALGRVPRLQQLTLDAPEVEMEGLDCLPPSLTWLYLVQCGLAEVPLAVTRLTNLQSLYLSRNELEGSTLPRLAQLPSLRLLSLIECFPRDPPLELSTLTQLSMLYLDYNFLDADVPVSGSMSQTLAPLTRLRALGLSHTSISHWPASLASFTALQVLYMERTGLQEIPESAAPLLRQLRMLSLDFDPFLDSAPLLRCATALHTLYLGGLHASALPGDVEAALCVLSSLLPPAGALQKLIIVVHTLVPELPSTAPFAFMLAVGRRCPGVEVTALDSEEFYGVTLEALDKMALPGSAAPGTHEIAESGGASAAAAGAAPAAMEG